MIIASHSLQLQECDAGILQALPRIAGDLDELALEISRRNPMAEDVVVVYQPLNILLPHGTPPTLLHLRSHRWPLQLLLHIVVCQRPIFQFVDYKLRARQSFCACCERQAYQKLKMVYGQPLKLTLRDGRSQAISETVRNEEPLVILYIITSRTRQDLYCSLLRVKPYMCPVSPRTSLNKENLFPKISPKYILTVAIAHMVFNQTVRHRALNLDQDIYCQAQDEDDMHDAYSKGKNKTQAIMSHGRVAEEHHCVHEAEDLQRLGL
mmetsp:Transcript_157118/g.273617  ORF Transcript_157118/g.273617 Transcript_157118/m.273617 type:complete len:265 (+) Transcript_157118:534-1328(+)